MRSWEKIKLASVNRDGKENLLSLDQELLFESPNTTEDILNYEDDNISDITDPFEDIHIALDVKHHTLDTPFSRPPMPVEKRSISRSSEFLKTVSLFSPSYQYAMLEAREQQGFSIQDATTRLNVDLIENRTEGTSRCENYAENETQIEENISDTSCSICNMENANRNITEVKQETSRKSLDDDERETARSSSMLSGSDNEFRRHSKCSVQLDHSLTSNEHNEMKTPPPLPVQKSGRESIQKEEELLTTVHDLEMCLEEFCFDINVRDSEQITLSRNSVRFANNYPADDISGVWRILDDYDEFVCTPYGYHAFRQDKPHWLDQEPMSWSALEAARKKCLRWLRTCSAFQEKAFTYVAPIVTQTVSDGDTEPESQQAAEKKVSETPTTSEVIEKKAPIIADHFKTLSALNKLKTSAAKAKMTTFYRHSRL